MDFRLLPSAIFQPKLLIPLNHVALLNGAQQAAQAKGRERYEGFVDALGRRLAKGRTLSEEISQDIGLGEGTELDQPQEPV